MINKQSWLTVLLPFSIFFGYGQTTWQSLNSLCPEYSYSIVTTNINTILLAKGAYICRAEFPFSTWNATTLGDVNCLAKSPTANNLIYAGTGLSGNGQVYKSSDDGVSFMQCAPLNTGLIEDIEVTLTGTVLVATKCNSVGCAGLFRSVDNGVSWTLVTSQYDDIICITTDALGSIYIGTEDPGSGGEAIIKKSVDDGITWTTLGFGELGTGYVRGISVDELGFIFALGGGGHLYVSNNGGPFSVSLSGLNWYERYAMLSTNCGRTLIGDYGNGIYETTDHGASWSNANTGINSLFVLDMVKSNSNFIFVACGPDAYMSNQEFGIPGTATIGGPINICEGTDQTYHATNFNATTGNWIVPPGWTIISGQGSTTIHVISDSTSGSVCATVSNSCGTGLQGCKLVSVSQHPDSAVVSGPSSVCEGSVQIYTASSANATGAHWTVPAGWSINTGQGTFTLYVTVGSNSGNICAYPTTGACIGQSGCIIVNVSQVPDMAVLNGPSSVCEGSSQLYTASSTNATGANWTVPAGWSINSGQGTFTLDVTAGNNSGYVCAYPTNGACTGQPGCTLVNVNQLPGNAGTIIGPNPVCINQEWIYHVPQISNATTYLWSLPSGDTITLTDSIMILFGNSPGLYDLSVKGQNICGDGISSTLNITIDPCSGINTIKPEVKISCLPTPSQGIIHVCIENITEEFELSIINNLGQLIFSEKSQPQSLKYSKTLDLSTQPKGVYFLNLQEKGCSFVEKIILN